MSENTQVYTVYIEAPASKVWQALTTSEFTNQWGYGGDVEYDLTPGGAWRNLTNEGMRAVGMGDVAVSGEVVSVDPGTRLAPRPAGHDGHLRADRVPRPAHQAGADPRRVRQPRHRARGRRRRGA